MEEKFSGKVALVTGGGTGIGKAIALEFAARGAAVFLAGRRESVLIATAEGIKAGGGRAWGVQTDVTNPEDVATLMARIRGEVGGIDILVNAAGLMRVGLMHESSVEDFDTLFDSNVKGLWLVSKMAVPIMLGLSNANIINVSSVAGTRTDVGLGLYEAGKAAVNTITKVMAKELASARIRVNAVAPGPVDTDLFHGSVFGDDVESKKLKEEILSSIPFGRMGTPEEVARLAVFLASPESDFISGSVTSIDGAMGY